MKICPIFGNGKKVNYERTQLVGTSWTIIFSNEKLLGLKIIARVRIFHVFDTQERNVSYRNDIRNARDETV